MKLTTTQKARIESGYAMVYVGEHGANRYIEHVFDIYGNPSKTYADKFYVWLDLGNVDWDAHPDSQPLTFKAAQQYVDAIKGEARESF